MSDRLIKIGIFFVISAIFIIFTISFIQVILKERTEDKLEQETRFEERIEWELEAERKDAYDRRLEESENAEWREKYKKKNL